VLLELHAERGEGGTAFFVREADSNPRARGEAKAGEKKRLQGAVNRASRDASAGSEDRRGGECGRRGEPRVGAAMFDEEECSKAR
jgi:hypothetical protein